MPPRTARHNGSVTVHPSAHPTTNLRDAHIRSRADYLALLDRIRPRTAALEFVVPGAVSDVRGRLETADVPLLAQLKPFDPETREGAGPRPGYPQADPTALTIRVRYDRGVFALLRRYSNLFAYLTSPRGDRVEFTEWGNVDLLCYDAAGRVVLATVTHEGLALERVGT